jgi:hypothetical protein
MRSCTAVAFSFFCPRRVGRIRTSMFKHGRVKENYIYIVMEGYCRCCRSIAAEGVSASFWAHSCLSTNFEAYLAPDRAA